jgi:hypothetical protein
MSADELFPDCRDGFPAGREELTFPTGVVLAHDVWHD